MTYLREFGKEIGKEFGVEVNSKKHENTKNRLEVE